MQLCGMLLKQGHSQVTVLAVTGVLLLTACKLHCNRALAAAHNDCLAAGHSASLIELHCRVKVQGSNP